jgi:hypothetical protein
MTSNTIQTIPDSVTAEDLCDALKPLLDLLGVRLVDIYPDLRIDFMSGVQFTTGLVGGIAANVQAGRMLGNASSEVCAMHTVRVTGSIPSGRVGA